jgi:hypothetical protein
VVKQTLVCANNAPILSNDTEYSATDITAQHVLISEKVMLNKGSQTYKNVY